MSSGALFSEATNSARLPARTKTNKPVAASVPSTLKTIFRRSLGRRSAAVDTVTIPGWDSSNKRFSGVVVPKDQIGAVTR